MKRTALLVALSCLALSVFAFAQSEGEDPTFEMPEGEEPTINVNWLEGPATGDLGSTAQVDVPIGYVFAGAADTKTLMEVTQNPVSGDEVGFLAPSEDDWFVVFEYDDMGYIKDDEKDALDADAMLKSIREATAASNKEREKRGWPTMAITGWEQPPHYDEATHNLEWAIKGESEGIPVINYNTRILGRGGVMSVTLVADPEQMPTTLPTFKQLLAAFDYKEGQRYAEYREGDKLAKYGLSALVVGGGAAAAAKAGVFRWLWKVLVAGAAGAAALFRKIFRRNS